MRALSAFAAAQVQEWMEDGARWDEAATAGVLEVTLAKTATIVHGSRASLSEERALQI